MQLNADEKFMDLLFDEHLERRGNVVLVCRNHQRADYLLTCLMRQHEPTSAKRHRVQYGPYSILSMTISDTHIPYGFKCVVIFDHGFETPFAGHEYHKYRRIMEWGEHTTRSEMIRRHKEKYG